ncbi:hypothetical protein [Lapidilactobacillus gannanensis]|uniref:Uncharacterized protein n=1 Tax=Lapidilactobacillus gannanensis TaxID=2486002 RepID=A0ABW4BL93_9LACO|nr:hypothetical protein [Lapidilactobacillus gannanensis]
MKIKSLRKTDQFILNSLLALLPLLMLPFLLTKQLKITTPKDFFWVLVFALIIILNQQAEDFWHWPHLLINCLLAMPVIFLFIEKSYLVDLLLLMQLIIKWAINPTMMSNLDVRLGLLLEEAIVPIFIEIALLAAVIDQINSKQIMLISVVYLSKVAFTLPFHQFLDFIWPFLAIILVILLKLRQISSLPAMILTLTLVLLNLLLYPRLKKIEQAPALLLLALVLSNTLL